ncbi:hypothetical protein [Saccharopolyspora sp. NPDC002686]|uniref:hypothetical protein n=1 Tax=Saccharopolyspora sp. NPDC002686 TaxID=3154541 RepID=UPI0033270C4F
MCTAGGRHPEVPDPASRDHSLLMTEAEQAETTARLVDLQQHCAELRQFAVPDPAAQRYLDEQADELDDLIAQACDALRNVVTVEERIGHLDFEPSDDV